MLATLREHEQILVPVHPDTGTGSDLSVLLHSAGDRLWLAVFSSRDELAAFAHHTGSDQDTQCLAVSGNGLFDHVVPQLPSESGLLLDPATTGLTLPIHLITAAQHDEEHPS